VDNTWTKTLDNRRGAETYMKELIMGKLTNASLKDLMEKRGRHGDGNGLFFRTIGQGRAYWCYRYRAKIDGKSVEREFSIGPYPLVDLAKARVEHAKLRKRVVADKADPLAEKQAAKEAAAVAKRGKPTFAEIADGYVAAKGEAWRNPEHRRQWLSTLSAQYIGPLRDMPVDEIGTKEVLQILEPLWRKTPETASRIRGRIEQVLNRARVLGHIDEDKANPARWRGHLDQLLANPKKVNGGRGHHAAMSYRDLPAFMDRLMRPCDGPPAPSHDTAAQALAFMILTAARRGEVLGTKWDEIDFNGGVWTAPGNRMKAGKAHRVPLSAPALAILKRQHEARGKNPYVFVGSRPLKPISPSMPDNVMRRLGASAFTVHGFRSAFRDWVGEETQFPREVAEAALAHAVGDETEQAYRRGDALQKRRELMEAWASFLMGDAGANVVPITSGRRA
jgi:integrase